MVYYQNLIFYTKNLDIIHQDKILGILNMLNLYFF